MNLKDVELYIGLEVKVTTFNEKNYYGVLKVMDENTISVGFLVFIDIADIKDINLLKS